MPRNRTIFAVLWIVSLLGLAGCRDRDEGDAAKALRLPVAPVRTLVIEPRSRPVVDEVVGTVRARLRATLEAKVSGRIEQMPVALGQAVKSGELIVRLNAPEIRARHDQARAALEQAEQDWRRATNLLESKVATRSEFDTADSRRRVALGLVAETEALLSYVEIVAPFDGVISRKSADVGDLAMPGKSLVELEDPRELELEAGVPESIVGSIRPGTRLAVRVNSMTNTVTGTVRELASAAEPATRTFQVKVSLPAAGGLRSGQFGRVLIPVGERASIHVPSTAVVYRGQMEIVFVVFDGHASLRLVRTGRESDGDTEILSGLEAGQTIVVDGAASLRDGQPAEAR